MVYALKCGDKYLRVGQMGRGNLMDRPEEGTLYREDQLDTAKRHSKKGYWIKGRPLNESLTIVELEFTFTERPLRQDRAGWHNKPRN